MKIKIFLASPRGYCAGVTRAINIVDGALEKYGVPLYVNHEIIHNRFIIQHFEKKGVIFGRKVEAIEPGNIIIFSAHGVGPEYIHRVKSQKLKYIDASCPLVIKVHKEAEIFLKKGFEILYIGKKGHQEAEGILEENREKIHIISKLEDIPENIGDKIALLNQTTLSVSETADLIEKIKGKFPNIILPHSSDICYATTNRQNAVEELCKKVDILFVVGSKNSSNSQKLKDIGEYNSIPSFLIDSYKDIDTKYFKNMGNNINIGLTGGASAPEKLIQEVVDFLKTISTIEIEILKTVEENMNFPAEIQLQA